MRNSVRRNVLFHPKSVREWGQTLVFMVFALPAFIGAMGLAADVGNFYYNYYKMQTAVDAATLAGATCLAYPSSAGCAAGPSSVAGAYSIKNGFTPTPNPPAAPTTDAAHCPTTNCKMTVSATGSVPYYFASLVGVGSGTIDVTGIGIGGPINTVTGDQNLMPIGLQYSTVTGFSPGTPVANLAANGTSGCTGTPPICPSGDWGWVSLDGTGHATVNSEIDSGYSGTVTQGTAGTACPGVSCILPQPGVGSSFTHVADHRAASTAPACSGQTWDSHPDDSPCAVTVILVDFSACSGGRCPSGIPVLGFAELWINSVTGVGAAQNITATWISDTVPGGGIIGGPPPGVQGGAVAIKLIQ
jgi:Flp pilus assembly protein TadG